MVDSEEGPKVLVRLRQITNRSSVDEVQYNSESCQWLEESSGIFGRNQCWKIKIPEYGILNIFL